MTAEQLERARAERLRHNGNAALTFEEAKTWLEETGLCLYLPRKAQIPTLAPSFAEAVEGRANPTPGAETLSTATSLLARLVAEGIAVPLNLLTSLGEQPDFLVAAWVLPYVFALRGERDWRRPPQTTGSRKVSQLSVEVIRILEAEGPLTTSKLKTQLGREVTEAATLRALDELWGELRIYPEPKEGKAPEWHLLKEKYMKAMQEGASTSQVTAISVLASIYLPAVIAATSEEVEIFLSPLTSRSKIREVLRGLTATRQINTLSLSAQSFYFVAGTLPDFPAAVSQTTIYPYAAHIDQDHEPLSGVSAPEGTVTAQASTSPARTTPTRTDGPKPAFRPAAARASSATTSNATNGWTRPSRPVAARSADSRGNFPPRRKESGFASKREGGFTPLASRPDAPRPIRGFPGGPILNAPAATSRPAAARPAANGSPRPLRAYPGGPILGGAAARPRNTTRPAAARPATGRPASGSRPDSRAGGSGSATSPHPPARTGRALARPGVKGARPAAARPNGTRPPRPAGTGKPFGARQERPGSARPAAAGGTKSHPNSRPAAKFGARFGTRPGKAGGTARPASKPRPARPATGSRPSGLRNRTGAAARPTGARTSGARPGAKSGTRPGAKPGKFAGAGGKKRS